MKKCPDCEREVDKHMIACQYCGKLLKFEQALEQGHKDRKDKRPTGNKK